MMETLFGYLNWMRKWAWDVWYDGNDDVRREPVFMNQDHLVTSLVILYEQLMRLKKVIKLGTRIYPGSKVLIHYHN